MDMNTKLFNDLSLADLLNDIYVNTRSNNRRIDAAIEKFNNTMKTINDAVVIAPIIKEYLDVAVKNDQHLIKLAEIVQKYINMDSKGAPTSSDGSPLWELSDDEKQSLIAEMDIALSEAQATLNKPLPNTDR